jgi:lysozyme family protein
MRGNLENCVKLTFGDEGGYVNNPHDPGGPTKYGITLKTLAAYRGQAVSAASASDVKALSLAEAAAILDSQYWRKVWGDELPRGVDYAMFDFAVNSGPAQAIKTAQRLLGVDHDGTMGAITLQAIQKTAAKEFIDRYMTARLEFMRGLGIWSTFGKGWSSRVAHVRLIASQMAETGRTKSIAVEVAKDLKPEPEEMAKAPPSATATISTSQGKAGATTIIGSAAAAVTTAVTTLTPYVETEYVKRIVTGLAVLGVALALLGGIVTWVTQRRHIAAGNPV